MVRKIFSVINGIVIGLMVFIFASTLYLTVSSRIHDGNPVVAGKTMYEVLSGSMTPTFDTGSVIFDNPHVNVADLKPGDIITFHVPQNSGFNGMTNVLVTHRIVREFDQNGQMMFQTKGDANPSVDPWTVSASNIVGEYTHFTIPYAGYYLNFLHGRWGDGSLLILPGAFLIISSMVSLFKEILNLQKKSNQENNDSPALQEQNAIHS
ncbi:signal peptidase I [Alicyclobacillus tolerans]|uniref:Signal peptidase I n=2 Tax=Alicyclobacillus tolerans TaxID=90970 RepID=A0A1M6Y2X7_9BACL|nr:MULTISPECIES: signal peptidase I [Alicyclobacillus]MDP9729511.1 signal peptidase [Alicyclobacillus tengchongensis]SHL12562.1 Signal peptidase I Serine peptidase. MEROPS family S26B [Alicyclobacillus montanus]